MIVAGLLGIVAGAGAVGGAVNALISDNGFLLPKAEAHDHGVIIRPGTLGNMAVGAVAAGVSWGLYGPMSAASLTAAQTGPGLTLAAFVGAVLVGMSGARWLTNEVDKRMLRVAASGALRAPAAPESAAAALSATPAQVLGLTRGLNVKAAVKV